MPESRGQSVNRAAASRRDRLIERVVVSAYGVALCLAVALWGVGAWWAWLRAPAWAGSGLVVFWILTWARAKPDSWWSLPVQMVVAPMLMRREKMTMPPRFTRIERPPVDLPPETARALSERRAELHAEGFVRGPCFEVVSRTGQPRLIIECFEHQARGHAATLSLPCTHEQGGPASSPVVRFVHVARDGTPIAVIDYAGRLFPRRRGARALAMPGTGVREMHELFLALLERFAPGEAPERVSGEGWEAHLMRPEMDEMERLVSRRYVLATGAPDEYRIAPRVLLFAAWRQMPCATRWLAARELRRSARLRREWLVRGVQPDRGLVGRGGVGSESRPTRSRRRLHPRSVRYHSGPPV